MHYFTFSLLWHVAIMSSIFQFCFSWSYISLLYYLAYLGLCLPFFFLMKSKRGRRVCFGYVLGMFVCWKFQDMKKSWIAKERGRYILSWLDQIFKRFCHHKKGGDWRSVFRLDTVAGLFWWLQSPMAKRRKELKMIKLKQDQVKIVIA